MHGSEAWELTSELTKKDCEKLSVFEKRALRVNYGPVNINGQWRIRLNVEHYYLYTFETMGQTIEVHQKVTIL